MNKPRILMLLLTMHLFVLNGDAMSNILWGTPKDYPDVTVDALLLNNADVSSLFNGTIDKSLKKSRSFDKDVHLVLRIKNTGNKALWGTLLCNVSGYREVRVYVPHLVPNMTEYANYIIPLTGMITLRLKDGPPSIETKWEEMNSK